MAKFCGNCGTPIDENASFCNVCGSAVQQKPVRQEQGYQQPTQQPVAAQPYVPQGQYVPQSNYGYMPEAIPTAAQKKKPVGLIIVLACLCLVAICAIVAFIVFIAPDDAQQQSYGEDVVVTQYSDETVDEDTTTTIPKVPYKKAMEHFCGGMGGNMDDVIACYPDEVVDILRENNDMTQSEFEAWAQEYADTIRQSIEENVGENCAVGFLVLEETKVNSTKLKKIQNQLSRSGMDVNVSEAYDFLAVLTFSGSKGERTEERELTALKIEGVWYITVCTENNSQIAITFF